MGTDPLRDIVDRLLRLRADRGIWGAATAEVCH